MQAAVVPALAVPPASELHFAAESAMEQLPSPTPFGLQHVTAPGFRPQVERRPAKDVTYCLQYVGSCPSVMDCLTAAIKQLT